MPWCGHAQHQQGHHEGDMAGSAVAWQTCAAKGCIGVRLPSGGKCWAHANNSDLGAALKQLGQDGRLNARGVPITQDLLERLLAAAPHDRNGRPVLEDAEFSRATFQDDARFLEVIFEGDAHLAGAIFQGNADFSDATFNRIAEFGSVTFQDFAAFTRTTIKGCPVWPDDLPGSGCLHRSDVPGPRRFQSGGVPR
jgi:Pentapeptide repeats (9 copies)